MVLVVDEYHLDIRANGELLNRYYLADVEVARDIAERFILFLGDDEMEFLAEDALQFAYDGVSAMQEAWLAAQKKKRRHRRAATQSARRKDEELMAPPVPKVAPPVEEPRPVRTRPAGPRRNALSSELAKRIAAATRAEAASEGGSATASPTDELEYLPYEPPKASDSPPISKPAISESRPPSDSNGSDSNGSSRSTSRNDMSPEEEPTPPKTRRASRPRSVEPVIEPASESVDEPEPPPVESPQPRRRTKKAAEEPVPDGANLADLEVDLVVAAGTEAGKKADQPEPESEVEELAGGRFAPLGHHPAETSVGLLSRLRRQPKVPTNHVHRYQEARLAVGLVRRVCVECSYVSIGSDD